MDNDARREAAQLYSDTVHYPGDGTIKRDYCIKDYEAGWDACAAHAKDGEANECARREAAGCKNCGKPLGEHYCHSWPNGATRSMQYEPAHAADTPTQADALADEDAELCENLWCALPRDHDERHSPHPLLRQQPQRVSDAMVDAALGFIRRVHSDAPCTANCSAATMPKIEMRLAIEAALKVAPE